MLVSINDHEGYPFEVVCTIGKGGASENAKAESIGRLISAMLQGGFSVEEPIKQLEGIVGAKPVFSELGLVKSIPDGIAKILRKHTNLENGKFKEAGFKELCPDCGNELTPDSGSCLVCTNCGYKSCGG
jgi:ribonucleoside-diphosphate reductase alpha chain